jgi:hypothetical protein
LNDDLQNAYNDDEKAALTATTLALNHDDDDNRGSRRVASRGVCILFFSSLMIAYRIPTRRTTATTFALNHNEMTTGARGDASRPRCVPFFFSFFYFTNDDLQNAYDDDKKDNGAHYHHFSTEPPPPRQLELETRRPRCIFFSFTFFTLLMRLEPSIYFLFSVLFYTIAPSAMLDLQGSHTLLLLLLLFTINLK